MQRLAIGASTTIPVTNGGILILRSISNHNSTIVVIDSTGKINETLNTTSASGIFSFNNPNAAYFNVQDGNPLTITNKHASVALEFSYKWLCTI